MSPRKSILWTAAVLLYWLPQPCSFAGDWFPAAGTNSAPQVALKSGEVIGSTPIQRAYVTWGTNVFVLVVPSEFRMDASNPERIVLINAESDCFLTVRINASETAPPEADTCREVVLKRYPGAQIVNEYSEVVGTRSGPAFDLQLKGVSGVSQTARVAFIYSPGGVLEFSAQTTANNFARGQYFFNFLLHTFRSNEGGKLVIEPFSDKT